MVNTRRTRTKPQANSVLPRIRRRVQAMQRDATALVDRARKQTSQLLSREQRRALDRLVSDIDTQGQRVAKQVESRMLRFFTTLEQQAEKRFERTVARLVWRLGLVSRKDVRGLAKRIDALEKRSGRRPTTRKKAGISKSPPPLPPDVIAPSSGD